MDWFDIGGIDWFGINEAEVFKYSLSKQNVSNF